MQIANPVQQTIEAYDRIAATYSNAWFDHPPVEMLNNFIGQVGGRKLILDAACGSGRDTNYFINQGIKAIGVDMSRGMLVEASSRVPSGEFVQMDIRHMAFPNNCFGGVWACAVLVHIPPGEICFTLRSFYRVLGVGGVLFVALHETTDSTPSIERISEDNRYFVAYSEQTIRRGLGDSGFNTVEIQRQVSYKSIYGNVKNAVRWLNILATK
jgi:ubiquinone/menaquinone biosynthesis C-methylase UbiE